MKKISKKAFIVSVLLTACTWLTTACGDNDDNDGQKSRTEQTAPTDGFTAYGVTNRAAETTEDAVETLFTDDNIEWFDLNTREIKFKKEPVGDPLHTRLYRFSNIAFRLGDMVLFDDIKVTTLADSRTYAQLVLCYGSLETASEDGEPVWGYYLYDCYPTTIKGDDAVRADRAKREQQWTLFVNYLESKGKLRR